jgi:hypothetical protein
MAKRNFACLVIVAAVWFADDAIARPGVTDAIGCATPTGCNKTSLGAADVSSRAMLREDPSTDRAGSLQPGDFCLSAFLSQCYPERKPRAPDAGDGANSLAR